MSSPPPNTETKKFRVKVIGPGHPHKGAIGMCDPTDTLTGGGSTPMARVTFDEPRHGVEACYAAAQELRKL